MANVIISFRSCSKRDQIGPLKMCDAFWLTTAMQNPLAVGQYVNNCSTGKTIFSLWLDFKIEVYFIYLFI